MKAKLFLGLGWLGQATKPDTTYGRFAKLAFALEALIGGEASDGNLSTRGLTATLAERAAFLAEESRENRQAIHDGIQTLYSKRTAIVHGSSVRISELDLSKFADLVRKVAWALLAKIDLFRDIDGLQSWVLEQRYE